MGRGFDLGDNCQMTDYVEYNSLDQFNAKQAAIFVQLGFTPATKTDRYAKPIFHPTNKNVLLKIKEVGTPTGRVNVFDLSLNTQEKSNVITKVEIESLGYYPSIPDDPVDPVDPVDEPGI